MTTQPSLRRVGTTLAFASLLAVTGCKKLKIESDKPQYQYGEVATMWVLFKDEKVPDGQGTFSWSSSRDGQIGSGNRITLDTLSAGTHTIEVEGSYNGKKAKSKKKKIEIRNEAPRAMVHAPLPNASFPVGTAVEFRGAANDLEDGQLSGAALEWRSSIDGALGKGSSITVPNLSPGSHRITLAARDAAGTEGTKTISLEVTNQAPVATISQPSGDVTLHVMEVLTLSGHATDPDPVLGSAQIPADQLSWRSDEDGELGTGATLSTANLSGGTHTVTLIAKDEFGKAGRASIKVRVINDPPTARITSPGNDQFFAANDTITFHVDARDPETTLDEDKIVWRSNKDGRIGRGFRLRTDDLSVNTHTITVTVTDRHGASVTDSVRVLITNEAPVASIERPLNGSRFRFGETIILRGSATDREDGNLSGSRLRWRARNLATNRTMDLGSGEREEVRAERLIDRLRGFGPVVITLVAEDSDDAKSEEARARIVLVNSEPTVRIGAPAADQTVSGAITLIGFGHDPDRNAELADANMSWSARAANGTVTVLGTGKQLSTTLAPGRYQITLTGTDPDDSTVTATASVRIRVGAATTAAGNGSGNQGPTGSGITAVVNNGN